MSAKLVMLSLSLLTLACGQVMAAECKATVESNDMMQFTTDTVEIDKSCKTFTVELKHIGSLPRNVMGHNWVLTKESDMEGVATDGMGASIDNSHIKEGDTRVIAHTKMIGGGESDSVTFDVSALDPAQKYMFFCSFPGHVAMMKGNIVFK